VLAINAWFGGLPEFRSSILVAASELAVTRPMPEKISNMGWSGGPYVNDSRLMVGALRALSDGRVMFGDASYFRQTPSPPTILPKRLILLN
jgi:hypothetical protein